MDASALRAPAPLSGALGVSESKRVSSPRIAGSLLLFAASIPIAIWVIVLFVGQPSALSTWTAASETAQSMLSNESPVQFLFLLIAGLAISLVILGACYFHPFARNKLAAKLLLTTNIALFVVAALWGPEHLSFFIAIPCWWGWKCIKEVPILESHPGAP